MSKYIRTEDRIIDTTKIITGSKYMDFATNDESFKELFIQTPLARDNTIEELSDYLVIFFKNQNLPHLIPLSQCKTEIIKLETNKEWFRYGEKMEIEEIVLAISTYKGIIYIAKKNKESGDFKLL